MLPVRKSAPMAITAILNNWKRHALCRQLDALRSQTSPPLHIWVCLFASPMLAAARAVLFSYNDSRIAVIEAKQNFGYYGRFQIALSIPTRFVLIIDDDMLPGRSYMAALFSTTRSPRGTRAALGSVGWLLPRPQPPPGLNLVSYRSLEDGGVYVPDLAYGIRVDRPLETDYLCSLWFADSAWIRFLFREVPHTFATGEDFHFSHMMRKHAGMRSLVMPIEQSDTGMSGRVPHISPTSYSAFASSLPLRHVG